MSHVGVRETLDQLAPRPAKRSAARPPGLGLHRRIGNRAFAALVQRAPHMERAYAGEQGVAFAAYRAEDGWIVVRGPSGDAGHRANAGGEDGVYYNIRSRELHIGDNKAFARRGNVTSATAIDPRVNLRANLVDLIEHVEGQSLAQLDNRQEILSRLRKTLAAVEAGERLPARVSLVVSNASGRSTGVSKQLAAQGIRFLDVDEPARPRPRRATAQPTPTEPAGVRTSADTGLPLTPIETPTPALEMHERQNALAGAASMLLTMQLAAVQGGQRELAMRELELLSPRIKQLHDQGLGVTVTIEVEVPDQTDIAALWAGTGDPGQIVYFRDMWINNASRRVGPQPPLPLGPHGKAPQNYHQNEAVGDADGREDWTRHEPRFPRHHLVTRDLYLPPESTGMGAVGARPLVFRPTQVLTPQPAGAFGDVGMHRLIHLDPDTGFHMWNTSSVRGYRRVEPAPDEPVRGVPRSVKLKNDAPGGRHTIDSELRWGRAADGRFELDETARFANLEPPYQRWVAKVHWVQE